MHCSLVYNGIMPPGIPGQHDARKVYKCIHHEIIAHAKAFKYFKEEYTKTYPGKYHEKGNTRPEAQTGIILSLEVIAKREHIRVPDEAPGEWATDALRCVAGLPYPTVRRR